MIDDTITAFYTVLQTAGSAPAKPSDLVADGRLHRHHIKGDKPGSRNGWHVIHCDPPASAAGGNWRTGARITWCGNRRFGRNGADLYILRQRIEADRIERLRAVEARQQDAAGRALWSWEHAHPANPQHPYLHKKYLLPGNARQRGAALVLPVLDFGGVLHGVQYIQPDGTKRFLAGTSKATHFIPASDELPDGTAPVWIAEG